MKYYADYDFEEAYQKQIDTLQEWEIEKLVREKKLGRIYMTQTTKAGDQLELDIYPAFGSRHDLPRGKRQKTTRAAVKRLNDKRARRKFINLINTNFNKGDLYCTFTYDEEHLPETIEEAQRIFRNYIKRINRWRAKQGKEKCKYIVVTELSTDKKRIHHHAIMSGDMDMDTVEKIWKHGRRNQIRRLEPDKDTKFTGVAEYISKDPKGRKKWNCSKGLKKPKVTKAFGKFSRRRVEKMARDFDYLKEQTEKRYPGYKFIKAEARVNDIDGGFYIYARMVLRS